MKTFIRILVPAFALTVAASESPARGEQGNLAIAANVSTSYVSGHETLTAVQDGTAPRSSGDTSHGAYGNWPKRGVQWIQYAWTRPVNIDGVSVYWYDDHRGVRVPVAARLLRWDGRAWIEIKGRDGGVLPLKKDAFNALTFESVTTDRLRLVHRSDRVVGERCRQVAGVSTCRHRPAGPRRAAGIQNRSCGECPRSEHERPDDSVVASERPR
jgi:hypothetical protein